MTFRGLEHVEYGDYFVHLLNDWVAIWQDGDILDMIDLRENPEVRAIYDYDNGAFVTDELHALLTPCFLASDWETKNAPGTTSAHTDNSDTNASVI